MKIIGDTGKGYIIEATHEEVSNLIGYSSRYANGYERPYVGDTIQISKMFHQLHDLENNRPKLRKTVETLRGIADLLEPVIPVIEKEIKEATK